MEDRIIYTALCYVEMWSLQFTCEYRMFGRCERFDRQFYQPYLSLNSEVLQTDVNSDMFVADFPLDSHFSASVYMRFVGWNKGHFLFSNCL